MGASPQFLQAYSIRFAHKKIGRELIVFKDFISYRLLVTIMRSLRPKKTDWVRFAWILQETGDLSSNQISYLFNHMWSNRSRSASSVGQIMSAHRTKGFETVDELTFGHEHIKIWTFYGELPEINRRTLMRWKESLNPLRGLV